MEGGVCLASLAELEVNENSRKERYKSHALLMRTSARALSLFLIITCGRISRESCLGSQTHPYERFFVDEDMLSATSPMIGEEHPDIEVATQMWKEIYWTKVISYNYTCQNTTYASLFENQ